MNRGTALTDCNKGCEEKYRAKRIGEKIYEKVDDEKNAGIFG